MLLLVALGWSFWGVCVGRRSPACVCVCVFGSGRSGRWVGFKARNTTTAEPVLLHSGFRVSPKRAHAAVGAAAAAAAAPAEHIQ
uniref:Putative secreted protein n=1 Tax=Anopheles marajoara TaxID=58244 RepID=A0A2M4CB20_9DIPT